MKRLICLLSLIALLLCLSTTAFAADTYVSDMNVVCDVQKNGNCNITMTVEVHFDSTVDSVRIPVGVSATKISATGGSFSRRTEDGCIWLVLKNAEGTQGTHTYTVSYTVKGAVTIESGSQKLELTLLCPYWEWRVDNLHFVVNLPKEFSGRPTYISGYYNDGIAVRDEITSTTIEGDVLSTIMDEESVTMTLELPSGYCRIWHRPGAMGTFCIVMMVILFVLAAGYWFFMLRNPLPGKAEQHQPPNGVGAWEFPYVSGSTSPDHAILIFEWANLGYLTILQNSRGRVTLRKQMEMGTERREYEQHAFHDLFANGRECPGDTASFRRTMSKAVEGSVNYWNTRLFSTSSGNPVLFHLVVAAILGFAWMRCVDLSFPSWVLRIILIIPFLPLGFAAGYILQQAIRNWLRKDLSMLIPGALIIVFTIYLGLKADSILVPLLALAAQLLSAIVTYRGGKRSQGGMDLIASINAYRKDLSEINSRQLQLILNTDPQYYYRILPYAEICNIGSKFAENFEHMRLDSCPWYVSAKADYRTASDFYPYFRDVLQRMRKGRRAKQ